MVFSLPCLISSVSDCIFIYLVGGLEHLDYFSIIYAIILPIDELHHFSSW